MDALLLNDAGTAGRFDCDLQPVRSIRVDPALHQPMVERKAGGEGSEAGDAGNEEGRRDHAAFRRISPVSSMI